MFLVNFLLLPTTTTTSTTTPIFHTLEWEGHHKSMIISSLIPMCVLGEEGGRGGVYSSQRQRA
jgi:hypothetical protein